MDKEIEEVLRQHIEDEETHHQETAAAILGLINDVSTIKDEVRANREAIRPWNELAISMEQAGRVGRIIRAIVGWCILAVSGVALSYMAFTSNTGE